MSIDYLSDNRSCVWDPTTIPLGHTLGVLPAPDIDCNEFFFAKVSVQGLDQSHDHLPSSMAVTNLNSLVNMLLDYSKPMQ